MIRLRPYKKSDAEYIMKWFTDKKPLPNGVQITLLIP